MDSPKLHHLCKPLIVMFLIVCNLTLLVVFFMVWYQKLYHHYQNEKRIIMEMDLRVMYMDLPKYS